MGFVIPIEIYPGNEVSKRLRAAAQLFAGMSGVKISLDIAGEWVGLYDNITYTFKQSNSEVKLVGSKVKARYKSGWYDSHYPELGRWMFVKPDPIASEYDLPRFILSIELK